MCANSDKLSILESAALIKHVSSHHIYSCVLPLQSVNHLIFVQSLYMMLLTKTGWKCCMGGGGGGGYSWHYEQQDSCDRFNNSLTNIEVSQVDSHIVAMWHLDIKHSTIFSCKFVLFVCTHYICFFLNKYIVSYRNIGPNSKQEALTSHNIFITHALCLFPRDYYPALDVTFTCHVLYNQAIVLTCTSWLMSNIQGTFVPVCVYNGIFPGSLQLSMNKYQWS